ncbi:hypothetical protein OTU49_004670 [Cherax quadricarinatus]|uniref:Supervillin n=2 Tax=Cherax quadricarinatus TaxID=27406 RepID=A0AAW0XBR0_CHEQU|nr:uncharacterized protein LOC128694285 isoform X1 [Cherax quadricarinatus]XP_053640328.1 uncharacterized protein LOC128694285 isoform X1 [Cherax quadricarinatus]
MMAATAALEGAGSPHKEELNVPSVVQPRRGASTGTNSTLLHDSSQRTATNTAAAISPTTPASVGASLHSSISTPTGTKLAVTTPSESPAGGEGDNITLDEEKKIALSQLQELEEAIKVRKVTKVDGRKVRWIEYRARKQAAEANQTTLNKKKSHRSKSKPNEEENSENDANVVNNNNNNNKSENTMKVDMATTPLSVVGTNNVLETMKQQFLHGTENGEKARTNGTTQKRKSGRTRKSVNTPERVNSNSNTPQKLSPTETKGTNVNSVTEATTNTSGNSSLTDIALSMPNTPTTLFITEPALVVAPEKPFFCIKSLTKGLREVRKSENGVDGECTTKSDDGKTPGSPPLPALSLVSASALPGEVITDTKSSSALIKTTSKLLSLSARSRSADNTSAKGKHIGGQKGGNKKAGAKAGGRSESEPRNVMNGHTEVLQNGSAEKSSSLDSQMSKPATPNKNKMSKEKSPSNVADLDTRLKRPRGRPPRKVSKISKDSSNPSGKSSKKVKTVVVDVHNSMNGEPQTVIPVSRPVLRGKRVSPTKKISKKAAAVVGDTGGSSTKHLSPSLKLPKAQEELKCKGEKDQKDIQQILPALSSKKRKSLISKNDSEPNLGDKEEKENTSASVCNQTPESSDKTQSTKLVKGIRKSSQKEVPSLPEPGTPNAISLSLIPDKEPKSSKRSRKLEAAQAKNKKTSRNSVRAAVGKKMTSAGGNKKTRSSQARKKNAMKNYTLSQKSKSVSKVISVEKEVSPEKVSPSLKDTTENIPLQEESILPKNSPNEKDKIVFANGTSPIYDSTKAAISQEEIIANQMNSADTDLLLQESSNLPKVQHVENTSRLENNALSETRSTDEATSLLEDNILPEDNFMEKSTSLQKGDASLLEDSVENDNGRLNNSNKEENKSVEDNCVMNNNLAGAKCREELICVQEKNILPKVDNSLAEDEITEVTAIQETNTLPKSEANSLEKETELHEESILPETKSENEDKSQDNNVLLKVESKDNASFQTNSTIPKAESTKEDCTLLRGKSTDETDPAPENTTVSETSYIEKLKSLQKVSSTNNNDPLQKGSNALKEYQTGKSIKNAKESPLQKVIVTLNRNHFQSDNKAYKNQPLPRYLSSSKAHSGKRESQNEKMLLLQEQSPGQDNSLSRICGQVQDNSPKASSQIPGMVQNCSGDSSQIPGQAQTYIFKGLPQISGLIQNYTPKDSFQISGQAQAYTPNDLSQVSGRAQNYTPSEEERLSQTDRSLHKNSPIRRGNMPETDSFVLKDRLPGKNDSDQVKCSVPKGVTSPKDNPKDGGSAQRYMSEKDNLSLKDKHHGKNYSDYVKCSVPKGVASPKDDPSNKGSAQRDNHMPKNAAAQTNNLWETYSQAPLKSFIQRSIHVQEFYMKTHSSSPVTNTSEKQIGKHRSVTEVINSSNLEHNARIVPEDILKKDIVCEENLASKKPSKLDDVKKTEELEIEVVQQEEKVDAVPVDNGEWTSGPQAVNLTQKSKVKNQVSTEFIEQVSSQDNTEMQECRIVAESASENLETKHDIHSLTRTEKDGENKINEDSTHDATKTLETSQTLNTSSDVIKVKDKNKLPEENEISILQEGRAKAMPTISQGRNKAKPSLSQEGRGKSKAIIAQEGRGKAKSSAFQEEGKEVRSLSTMSSSSEVPIPSTAKSKEKVPRILKQLFQDEGVQNMLKSMGEDSGIAPETSPNNDPGIHKLRPKRATEPMLSSSPELDAMEALLTSASKKKKRGSELDILYMDEGVLNLLTSLEPHSRRSHLDDAASDTSQASSSRSVKGSKSSKSYLEVNSESRKRKLSGGTSATSNTTIRSMQPPEIKRTRLESQDTSRDPYELESAEEFQGRPVSVENISSEVDVNLTKKKGRPSLPLSVRQKNKAIKIQLKLQRQKQMKSIGTDITSPKEDDNMNLAQLQEVLRKAKETFNKTHLPVTSVEKVSDKSVPPLKIKLASDSVTIKPVIRPSPVQHSSAILDVGKQTRLPPRQNANEIPIRPASRPTPIIPESREIARTSVEKPRAYPERRTPPPQFRRVDTMPNPSVASLSPLLKPYEGNGSQKNRQRIGGESVRQSQRASVRQSEGNYHYRDISLRKFNNFTQIILSPSTTKMKNALNSRVLRELCEALNILKRDESVRIVLLTATGSTFCQGVDLTALQHHNIETRKKNAENLVRGIKDFLKALVQFPKPIVAGVNGNAMGLGVTMLPLFDVVIANDKAEFYLPYAKLGQVPEGGATYTFPNLFGKLQSTKLFLGHKLTASKAQEIGLVSESIWPATYQQELIPKVALLATQSAQSMEATKALMNHHLVTKLELSLESECRLLLKQWLSLHFSHLCKRFLDTHHIHLQKPVNLPL